MLLIFLLVSCFISLLAILCCIWLFPEVFCYRLLGKVLVGFEGFWEVLYNRGPFLAKWSPFRHEAFLILPIGVRALIIVD